MKAPWKLLENILRRRLMEAKCPSCGTDGAYIGFNSVECENPKCRNYKPSKDAPANKAPQGKAGLPAWKAKVEAQATKLYGPKWKDTIDKHQGFPGAADWLLEQLHKRGYPADENQHGQGAIHEVGFYYDMAQSNEDISPSSHYSHIQLVKGKVNVKPMTDIDSDDYADVPDIY